MKSFVTQAQAQTTHAASGAAEAGGHGGAFPPFASETFAAQLLWLAPKTVGKHLENVYAKLGVSTRTAAVARFSGLIDTEAS